MSTGADSHFAVPGTGMAATGAQQKELFECLISLIKARVPASAASPILGSVSPSQNPTMQTRNSLENYMNYMGRWPL